MKRDMNLIRLLLLETEGEEPKPDLSPYNDAQRIYHSALLIEAGLVDGQIIQDSDGQPAATVTLRLTWAGHEFLDAARNDTIWHKAGGAGQKSWSAGLQPAFNGIFGEKPSAIRRSDFSTFASNFFVLHPQVVRSSFFG
jgi:hypothetical protein